MDPQIIKQRIDRLHEALEDPASAYKGGDSLQEITAYIAQIHEKLSGAIYNGFEGAHDNADWLRDRESRAQWQFVKNHDRLMEELRTGEFYDEYAQLLLRSRLFEEVGPRYENKALKIDIPVRLQMDSRAIVGYADEFRDAHMFFNPDGVVLMSGKIKRAGLSHEAAHIALGHTAKSFNPPDDRRKLELDAVYVGALIHGDPKAYNELNHFSKAWVEVVGGSKGEDMEEYLNRRRDELYERSGHQPGENEQLDKRINLKIDEQRYHRDYARTLIYPGIDEKIALVDSIEPPKKGIRGKWTQRNALADAIKERHVATGLPGPV